MKTMQINSLVLLLFLILAACSPEAAVSKPRDPMPMPDLVNTITPAANLTPLPGPTLQKSTPPPISRTEPCKNIAFVLSGGENQDIYSVCPDGSHLTQLTDSPAEDTHPAWSPDGKQISFVSTRSGNSQIYVMNEDGSNPLQLTSDDENDFPIWLPDGLQIAFRTTDNKGLWWWRIVNIKNHLITQLTQPSFDFFFQTPAWSPDGQKMVYMSLEEQKLRNDGSSQIHVKNGNGQNDVALTADIWANISPAWSPDGLKIAFFSERDGTYNQYALYVMSTDGTNLQRITAPNYSEDAALAWSPDSRSFAVSDLMASKNNITLIDLQSHSQRALVSLPPGNGASSPAWQP
jgi:Tol biopolymer transport system component